MRYEFEQSACAIADTSDYQPGGSALDAITVHAGEPGGTPQIGRLLELSTRDVRLGLERPLHYGTVLNLELEGGQLHGRAKTRGMVHWCRRTNDCWQVGVFLHKDIPEDLPNVCWWEMRKEVRYETNWTFRLRWKRTRERFPVDVMDYSIGGVSLMYDAQAPIGEEFALFESDDDDQFAIVNGRVLWHSDTPEGRKLLGCDLPDEQGKRLPMHMSMDQQFGMTAEDFKVRHDAAPSPAPPMQFWSEAELRRLLIS